MKLSDDIGNANPDHINESLLYGWQCDAEALEQQIEAMKCCHNCKNFHEKNYDRQETIYRIK